MPAIREHTRRWKQISRQYEGGGYDLELESFAGVRHPVIRLRTWNGRGEDVREVALTVDPNDLADDLSRLVAVHRSEVAA